MSAPPARRARPPRREAARGAKPSGARAWLLGATLALVLLGVVLRMSLPAPATRTPDERTYTTFAAGFLDQGYGRYPQVVQGFLADPSLAELPSPLRVGYLAVLSAAMGISGDRSSATGALLSQLASIATLVLAAWLAWRFLPPAAAPIALLFLAVSPMDLAVARRAWQDGVFGFAVFAMFAAVLVHADRPRRRSLALFFAAAFAALLIKETALLALALGAAALAWIEWRRAGLRGIGAVALGTIATLLATAGALAIVCGGVGPLVKLIQVTAAGRATSDYVRQYQTGSPMYYVTGLGILEPLPWLLAALTAVVAVAWPRGRSELETTGAHSAVASPTFLLAALWLAFLLVLLTNPLKGLRFLTPLFAPTALLAAAGLRAALAALAPRMPRGMARGVYVVASLALLASAFGDLRRFFDLFVRRGIPDLATPWFTAPH